MAREWNPNIPMSEQVMKKPFKAGDRVWFVNGFGEMMTGIILNLVPPEDTFHVPHLKVLTAQPHDEKILVMANDCYDTKDELIAHLKEGSKKQYERYLQEIDSAEALVRFMSEHQLAGDYYDDIARKAAVTCAEKLLGIKLREEWDY